jgi:ATP-dependent DNA helicase RecQ
MAPHGNDRNAEARRILQSVFGHEEFRIGQASVVTAILAGRDVLTVRATGFGKSLCYQLPALMLDRPTVVVSPLIALMQDQVAGLARRGVDSAALTSALGSREREALISRIRESPPRILFLSPEKLATARMRALAPYLAPARLIVDEAHCISDWGHDFRPDYRNINRFLSAAGRPPVAAFTATATPQTRKDIEQALGLRRPARFVSTVDRPNLSWSVSLAARRGVAMDVLIDAVRTATGAGGLSSALVYLLSRAGTVRLAQALRRRGIGAAVYHAGLDAPTRGVLQDGFLSGRYRVMCATSAFGMGVDHPEIRLVTHLGMPAALEAYVQEAGRAGRDGKSARCLLLPTRGDVELHMYRIRTKRMAARSNGEPGGEIAARARARLRAMRGYVTTRGCRRAAIARYFGEPRPACGGCDRCGPPAARAESQL